MPDPFAALALPADQTARFHPTRPGTSRRFADASGEPMWLELLGWSSKAAQDHRFAREERMRRTGRLLTPDEEWLDGADLLAKLTTAWRLVGPDGTPLEVECSFDTARALWASLDHRWLRLQAIAFLDNEGNFLPPSWRTS